MKFKFNHILKASVAIIFSVTLASCFTGIESTPKITAKDVKRENIPVRPESDYLKDIIPQPFTSWQAGKQFYVSDSKFKNILVPDPSLIDYRPEGSIVKYESFREITDVTGNKVMEILFTGASGEKLTYRTSQSLASVEKSGELRIPFLVEMDVIESVKSRLVGNTYYIITSSWYDTDNKFYTGRKFIPVTVTDVLPGNSFYSAILCMKDDNDKPFRLFLSVGNDLRSLRRFDSMFSMKNPRESYPAITDAVWNNIINGRVADGMTKDECRLALGSPKDVTEQFGYSTVREIWSYENGIFLIFEDSILRSFRQ